MTNPTPEAIEALIADLRDAGDHAAFEPSLHHEAADMLTAISQRQRVKPLVWEHDATTYFDRESKAEKPSAEFWTAETNLVIGRYSIMLLVDDRAKRRTEYYFLAIRAKEFRFISLEDAKAAAQKDYEVRILSALEDYHA